MEITKQLPKILALKEGDIHMSEASKNLCKTYTHTKRDQRAGKVNSKPFYAETNPQLGHLWD